MVYGIYQQQKSVLRETALALAGRLWNDDDLNCCKMDDKCQPLLDPLESMKTCDYNEERVFKAWKESWETYTLKPKGDSILEAKPCRKYGGIQWLYTDNGYVNLIAHPERM